MLHALITAHREEIIRRARHRFRSRVGPNFGHPNLEQSVATFLTQVCEVLSAAKNEIRSVGPTSRATRVGDNAAAHGHEVLRTGLTIAEVVNGYGDVCQVVTELATETGYPITGEEFHSFNECLDEAMARAVTAYCSQRERDLAYEGSERLGVLAHEMRSLLNTMTLSLGLIKEGKVGLTGSTGAMLMRSLSGLCALVDRSVGEVRLENALPKLAAVSMVDFIEEMQVHAAVHAEGYQIQLTVEPVDRDLTIDADWQLLASALSSLLENAFKFTRAKGRVSLSTRVTEDRVLIDVSDECGGLPPGKIERLFLPFSKQSVAHSGLGLGLSIALSAVRANAGDIHVRDVPGTGCVFSIDLPRRRPQRSAIAS